MFVSFNEILSDFCVVAQFSVSGFFLTTVKCDNIAFAAQFEVLYASYLNILKYCNKSIYNKQQ